MILYDINYHILSHIILSHSITCPLQDKMSLELDEPPDSIYQYHLSRMKTCCATLLTISSFDKEVTQAIVLGR
jgi:hypothetical protein